MASEAVMNEGRAARQQELDEEADLVRLAKGRSPEAWTEIYERNQGKLFRYVLARVGDRDTAEDLTATVFMEALKSIDSYASRGRPLLAWLYRITRNVVNYHHRSHFRRKAGQQFLGLPVPALPWQGEQPSASEAIEPADPASIVGMLDLREAIGRLSGGQREVIILRYYVGLTTPEVANLIGKHERAVYSLQTRAIKALRRELA